MQINQPTNHQPTTPTTQPTPTNSCQPAVRCVTWRSSFAFFVFRPSVRPSVVAPSCVHSFIHSSCPQNSRAPALQRANKRAPPQRAAQRHSGTTAQLHFVCGRGRGAPRPSATARRRPGIPNAHRRVVTVNSLTLTHSHSQSAAHPPTHCHCHCHRLCQLSAAVSGRRRSAAVSGGQRTVSFVCSLVRSLVRSFVRSLFTA